MGSSTAGLRSGVVAAGGAVTNKLLHRRFLLRHGRLNRLGRRRGILTKLDDVDRHEPHQVLRRRGGVPHQRRRPKSKPADAESVSRATPPRIRAPSISRCSLSDTGVRARCRGLKTCLRARVRRPPSTMFGGRNTHSASGPGSIRQRPIPRLRRRVHGGRRDE